MPQTTKQYIAPQHPILLSPGTGQTVKYQQVVQWQAGTLEVDSYQLEVRKDSYSGPVLFDSGSLANTVLQSTVTFLYELTPTTYYVTLSFVDSGQTYTITDTWEGRTLPDIVAPKSLTYPFGGYVKIILSQYDTSVVTRYEIREKATPGTVLFSRETNVPSPVFWSYGGTPPEDLLEVRISIVGHPEFGEVLEDFKFKTQASGETQGWMFNFIPTLKDASETLAIPTVINLWEDGTESRFTTSNAMLLTQSFKVGVIREEQARLLHRLRTNGRKYTLMPLVPHLLTGKLQGNVLKLDPGCQGLSWYWEKMDNYQVLLLLDDGFWFTLTDTPEHVTDTQITLPLDTSFQLASGPTITAIALPVLKQIPEFTAVKSAGTVGVEVSISGMETAINPLIEQTAPASLLHSVGNYKVLPVLSLVKSRKFTQKLENTTGGKKPQYYPVGLASRELATYTASWQSEAEKSALVQFFWDVKGAQKSFLLQEVSDTLFFQALSDPNTAIFRQDPDRFSDNLKYVVISAVAYPEDETLWVGKVLNVATVPEGLAVTTQEPWPTTGLTCVVYREAVNARLTDPKITFNTVGHGQGSTTLSFTEVL